jgi:hypothetical protein
MNEIIEIMDISRQLSDPQQAKNDMSEAADLVLAMLRKKYLNKMQDTLTKVQEHSRRTPPKEVALLHSLKPFMHETAHAQIDRLAETLILADTMKRLQGASAEQGAVAAMSAPNPRHIDSAIHPDGVYEVDYDCSPHVR